MLTLRKEQLDAIESGAFDEFVSEVVDRAWEYSPYLCKTLRDEELRSAVIEGIRRAEGHGFTQRGPARFYVETMIAIGSGFDTDPQYPWARETLASDVYWSSMDRANALHAKVVSHLAQVDGEANVYTRAALARLGELVRKGLSVRQESLEQDLLELMTSVHPRKAAEAGEDALRDLIAHGIRRSHDHYGFREARSHLLVVTLMFAFGHAFDRDPFLPWIQRTLDARGGPDMAPDLVAERLERRSMIWLDAVLKNGWEVA